MSLAVMYNTNPELPRLAGQELMAWVHSGIQKGVSIATGESSPDITEPDGEMGKGAVVRKSPPVRHEPKTDAAKIETAAQKPAPDVPQANPLQLEEALQQSGLLVERMDDDILKVNLSGDGMFAFGSAGLKDGARSALGKLADVLRKQDDLTIQVVGHTDSSGAAEYNLHLSQLRAKAVADYLISQGLTDSSIQSEGRGDRDTRLEQPSSYNPKLKRRVEIYIKRAQEG
jgi:outer membrane protein OmpA-like peptidoglycan-associated protein